MSDAALLHLRDDERVSRLPVWRYWNRNQFQVQDKLLFCSKEKHHRGATRLSGSLCLSTKELRTDTQEHQRFQSLAAVFGDECIPSHKTQPGSANTKHRRTRRRKHRISPCRTHHRHKKCLSSWEHKVLHTQENGCNFCSLILE